MANEEHVNILRRGPDEWDRWRQANPDVRPDLSGAYLSDVEFLGSRLALTNLSDTNLSRATLVDAELGRCNFDNADLSGALCGNAHMLASSLRNANLLNVSLFNASLINSSLQGAILEGADLRNANLSGASLEGANLRSTLLSQAIFNGVDLKNADLWDAEVGYTTFGNNDLSSTRGLETVRHSGPSVVGVDTIYRSGGMIAEPFLRGCGVSEDFITYMHSLTAKAIQFYSCFISYSHADKPFARRLHDALQGSGIRCWLDEHQLLPGDDIFEQVDQGIRLWDKVLLCCSKDSLTSWWVDNEVNTAFEKEQELMRQRGEKTLALVPLNLDGYMFSGKWKSGKASQVKSRLAADFTGWETDNRKFEEQFERLMKALRTDGGREPPPQPKI